MVQRGVHYTKRLDISNLSSKENCGADMTSAIANKNPEEMKRIQKQETEKVYQNAEEVIKLDDKALNKIKKK